VLRGGAAGFGGGGETAGAAATRVAGATLVAAGPAEVGAVLTVAAVGSDPGTTVGTSICRSVGMVPGRMNADRSSASSFPVW
jgi:hypothetical protein